MTNWALSRKFKDGSTHENQLITPHQQNNKISHDNSNDAEKKTLTNLACFHNKTSKSLGIKMNILHIIRALKKKT